MRRSLSFLVCADTRLAGCHFCDCQRPRTDLSLEGVFLMRKPARMQSTSRSAGRGKTCRTSAYHEVPRVSQGSSLRPVQGGEEFDRPISEGHSRYRGKSTTSSYLNAN
jgi:hypothetical protein